MSSSFNKNLATFLTEAKEAALNELSRNNPEHKKLADNHAKISANVKNEIPDRYEALLDNLTDSICSLARMEMNYLYLRGFKDCISPYKRLDGSFPESEDFEKFFTA